MTGPGSHPAFYIMGAVSFRGLRRPGRGVDHPPHLTPRLRKEKIYACTPFVASSKVNFTFTSLYFLHHLSPSIFLLHFLLRSFPSYLFFTSFSLKKHVPLLSHNLFSISVLICSEHYFIQSHQFSQVSGQYIRREGLYGAGHTIMATKQIIVAICLMVAVLLAEVRSAIHEKPKISRARFVHHKDVPEAKGGVDQKATHPDADLTTVRDFHFIMIMK
jgi:hypothetical protein